MGTENDRRCPACDSPIPGDAVFCHRCGAATPANAEPPTDETTVEREAMEQLQAALGEQYVVRRQAGAGGMATVYQATDTRHQREVAVKVLRPELAASVGAQRFLLEIEIAAKLNHPHVLTVFDSGDANGLLYYVMPFVEGETLEDRLERAGRFPPDEAIRLAREIAGALQFAHERDIIHRDIKPGNVMLQAGHALVTDFGIARALQSSGGLTEIGYSVGTPHYMSPEQALGEPDVDGRTDIYSVGAVLYEMLTGTVPFDGETTQAVLAQKMVSDALPLDHEALGVPSVLDRVVQRAMAKDPGTRYQTAAELVDALVLVDMNVLTEGVRSALQAVADPPSSTSTSSAQRRIAITAGVVTATSLGVVYGVGQLLGLSPWVFLTVAVVATVVAAVTHVLQKKKTR